MPTKQQLSCSTKLDPDRDPTAWCPVRNVLGRLAGKWTTLVISTLESRPHRYGELRRAIPDISQRMLTQTLRDLQQDGLISRTVLPTAPPMVEYRLTPLGESFVGPLQQILTWAVDNQHTIRAARETADYGVRRAGASQARGGGNQPAETSLR